MRLAVEHRDNTVPARPTAHHDSDGVRSTKVTVKVKVIIKVSIRRVVDDALRQNAEQTGRTSGGRPVWAVISQHSPKSKPQLPRPAGPTRASTNRGRQQMPTSRGVSTAAASVPRRRIL